MGGRQCGNIRFVLWECYTGEVFYVQELKPADESSEFVVEVQFLFISLPLQPPDSLACWAVKVKVLVRSVIDDLSTEVSSQVHIVKHCRIPEPVKEALVCSWRAVSSSQQ